MKKQSAFTLLEIMVALLAGLIVVGGALTVYIAAVTGSSDIVKSARLNHDMDSALALMINDIRRAGYWDNPTMLTTANPFTQATTDLMVSNNCVLYTYDGDAGGVAGTVDATEFYGFKLNNGNIQMRLSGTTTADCNDGTWATLNISQGSYPVVISTLNFAAVFNCLRNRAGVIQTWNAGCAGQASQTGDRFIETREVTISLAGHIDDANDDIAKNQLSNNGTVVPYSVKVRNDRIFEIP